MALLLLACLAAPRPDDTAPLDDALDGGSSTSATDTSDPTPTGSSGPQGLFRAAFVFEVDGEPLADTCLGGFASFSAEPSAEDDLSGVLSCAWQGPVTTLFGIPTMGGLLDGQLDGETARGSWSLGPIRHDWSGTWAEGQLDGAFSCAATLEYGGASVSYTCEGQLAWP